MLFRHIILRDILDKVYVVNFRKNYTVLDNYSIKRKGKSYRYDSIATETVPVQTSDYVCFIEDCTINQIMKSVKNDNMYKLIKAMRDIILLNHKKRDGIWLDKYSHHVDISKSELMAVSGVNRKAFYSIMSEAEEKLEVQMVDDEPHIHLDNLPVIIPDRDGTISLSYAFSPFRNKTEVLIHEEASAMSYNLKHGNAVERKMWSKPVMQRVFVNLGMFVDYKPDESTSLEDYILYYIYCKVMERMQSSMNIGIYGFSFDFAYILSTYKLLSGELKTEREARKVVKGLIDRRIIIDKGEREGYRKIYVLNELLVTL